MPGSSEFLFQLVGEKGIYKLSRVDRYGICRLEGTGSGRLPDQYKKPKIKTMPSVRKHSGGSLGIRANPERGIATGPEKWGNTQQSWDFFFDWSCVQRQEKQYVYMLPSGIINYTG